MLSMTAFASREIQLPEGRLRWEIKSVNHRFLEPFFRLPESFQDLEYTLRKMLTKHLHRGKIQCNLYLETPSFLKKLEIDLDGVDELIAASRLIKDRLKTARDISPLEILSWPNITKQPIEAVKTLEEPIKHLFTDTLLELIEERAREGLELKNAIQIRLDNMTESLNRIKNRLPLILSHQREQLLEKIAGLNLQLDFNRLEQELVFIAQKIDVSEEIDRLETHLKAISALLDSEGLLGRRLDFLMQELNREANTLASKSIDVALTQETVELKVSIEQMREQIQNVE